MVFGDELYHAVPLVVIKADIKGISTDGHLDNKVIQKDWRCEMPVSGRGGIFPFWQLLGFYAGAFGRLSLYLRV